MKRCVAAAFNRSYNFDFTEKVKEIEKKNV